MGLGFIIKKALHFLPKVTCRDGQKCGVLHELRKNYNSAHVVVSTEDRFLGFLGFREIDWISY